MPIGMKGDGSNLPSGGLPNQLKLVVGTPERVRLFHQPVLFNSIYKQTGKQSTRFIVEVGKPDKSRATLLGPSTLLRELSNQWIMQGKAGDPWGQQNGCWVIILKTGSGEATRYAVSIGETCPITIPDWSVKSQEMYDKHFAWALKQEQQNGLATTVNAPVSTPINLTPTPATPATSAAPVAAEAAPTPAADPLNW